MQKIIASGVVLLLLSTAFALGSCSGDSGVTFEEFRDTASELAGRNATDCGHADIDLGSEQNICIGNAYVSQNAASATYDGHGVDSRVAVALAVTEYKKVYLLSFDGDPTGGSSLSNGKIYILPSASMLA